VNLDGCQVEVATFRADGPYSDSRHPDTIEFSDAKSDASRRDFTINALFLDPLSPPEGEEAQGSLAPRQGSINAEPTAVAQTEVVPVIQGRVIDHVGGVGDLKARRIRAVGNADQRLAEDHLRALRAVRFAARLGFSIDDSTGDAIRRHAMELRGISRERIGEEIRRMMELPSRAVAASLLQELGLDAPVLDEPTRIAPVPVLAGLGETTMEPARSDSSTASRDAHSNSAHEAYTQEVLSLLRPRIRHGTALAAWVIDRDDASLSETTVRPWQLGKPAAKARAELVTRLRRALCLSNDERDDFRDVLEGVGVLLEAWPRLSVAGQKRVVARRWFREALRLILVRDREVGHQVAHRTLELHATPTGIAPEPFVTGDDLIAMGLKPSPEFRSVLDRVFDAQLEGRVSSKVEALELARELRV